MSDKRDVLVQHFINQSAKGPINILQEFDETQSLDIIERKIRERATTIFKDGILQPKPLITILHTDGMEFVLNDQYFARHQLFETDDPNPQKKILKVYWDFAKTAQPTRSNDASTQTDDAVRDTHEKSTSEGCNYSIDSVVKLLETIKNSQSASHSEVVNKDEFDQYIQGYRETDKVNQIGTANTTSTSEILETLTDTPASDRNGGNNSNEQVLSSTATDSNSSVPTQNRRGSKRPNSSKNNTTKKKPRSRIVERSRSCPNLPTKMVNIKVLANKTIMLIEDTYVATNISLINEFNWDNMIQFPKGINPTGRERYLTDANKPSCIQREKSPGRHSRDRALPVLKLPDFYHAKVMAGEPVMMGLACVKQCQKSQVEKGEEIEYCQVGYIQFKCYSEEKETMLPMKVIDPSGDTDQAKQLISEIGTPNHGNNEYTLIARPFKVKDQFRNEIGPAMFRLSPEYIKAAERHGLTFAGRESEHCYAAYLFKREGQTEQYEPDFQTLALSFYKLPENV